MLEISFGLCKTVGTVKKHGFCPKTGKMPIGNSQKNISCIFQLLLSGCYPFSMHAWEGKLGYKWRGVNQSLSSVELQLHCFSKLIIKCRSLRCM